jgi:hypothetical protein
MPEVLSCDLSSAEVNWETFKSDDLFNEVGHFELCEAISFLIGDLLSRIKLGLPAQFLERYLTVNRRLLLSSNKKRPVPPNRYNPGSSP